MSTDRSVRHTGDRTSSAGDYTYRVPEQEDPLNARIHASLNNTLDELPDTFENWDKDRVREAVAGLQRADVNHQASLETQKTGNAWTKLHPEYVDSDANAYLMRHQLRSNGITHARFEDFDLAYQQLRESNLLKLDQTVVNAQEIQAAKVARKKAQKATLSEEDLYNMPMEDLRRLDSLEAHERMQRVAERGGFDAV
jgi:hypothetical protein